MSITVTGPQSNRPARVSVRRGGMVVTGAVLAATAVWLVGRTAGTEFRVVMGDQPAMTIEPPFVVLTALLASLAGWAALIVLRLLSRRGRTLWTWLALVTLAVSLVPVAAVETTAATRMFLTLMHVSVAAVLVPGLRGAAAERTVAS
jgi:hypothetical protein